MADHKRGDFLVWIEDQPDEYPAFHMFLSSIGYRYEIIRSYSSAISQLDKLTEATVLLVDLLLPEDAASGYDDVDLGAFLILELRRRRVLTPVVAYSNVGGMPVPLRAELEALGIEILPKTARLKHVQEALSRAKPGRPPPPSKKGN